MRKLLYVDEDALNDYISEIDGYISNESVIEETITKTKGGKAGIKNVANLSLSGDNVKTTKKQIQFSVAAKLEKVMKWLENKNELLYYDKLDEESLSLIKRNDFCEFTAIGRLTNFQSMMDLASNFFQSFGNVKGFNESINLDDSAINQFDAVQNFTKKDSITIVFQFENDFCPIVSCISKKNITRNIEELLNKDVDFLCKVKKIHKKGEIIKLDEILRNIPSALEKSSLDYSNPEEIEDHIIGPALTVSIVAIYE